MLVSIAVLFLNRPAKGKTLKACLYFYSLFTKKMSTRQFKIEKISLEKLSELIANAKAKAEAEKLDISQEVAEKYKMKTLRKNKRPLYKWYSYKS